MEEVSAVVNCLPTPQPVHPDVRATDMKLRLKENTTYIVAGVVIQGGRVLLIQEAKPSCRGEWYLPAGRMEKNESLIEAVKREVFEESGHKFEPEALVAVECPNLLWVRFTLAGRIIGGHLKTTKQADKESLQAGWFSADIDKLPQEVQLRAHDVLPLIQTAGNWFAHRQYTGLPVAVGHVSSSQRVVLVHDDGQELRVLLSRGGGTSRLPVCLLGRDMYEDPLNSAIRDCGYQGHYQICGVLSVEHLGKPHGKYDGICITYILNADSLDLVSKAKTHEFNWTVVTGTLAEKLRTAMQSGGSACVRR